MIQTWNVTIPELTGTETRRAYLYLPDGYDWEPDRHYPVLYMFDGHNVFFDDHATYGKSWGLGEYLDEFHVPLIVAAVECNHHPDNGRLSEYSPYTFYEPDFGHVPGRGKITMDWFVRTFKPTIDKKYRTLPDRQHTFIAGSSMGGLMSLYAVMKYNKVFSRCAALSPSIWFSTARLDKMLSSAKVKKDTVIYMDYGEREMSFHPNMAYQFALVTQHMLARGLNLTTRIVPGGNHNEESWEKQLPFFIPTLLYGLEG